MEKKRYKPKEANKKKLEIYLKKRKLILIKQQKS